MDFEKELAGISEIVPADYELASETIPIAVSSLDDINRRYGSGADQELSFHNAAHSVGVARRAVMLTTILRPHMRSQYQDRVFDLAIIAGAAHDYQQDNDPRVDPGKNEQESAKFAIQAIEDEDGQLSAGSFTRRLREAVLATTAPMNENGEIVQTNLHAGSHDPMKFDMAFSDINGIAMEGSGRMVLDATNLYLETISKSDQPFSVDGLYDFYLTQANFLRQRLNPGRVKADIAYYFADNIEAVYSDMFQHFNHNIVSAYELALHIKEHPELKTLIGAIAKGIDRSRIGRVMGETLARKLLSAH